MKILFTASRVCALCQDRRTGGRGGRAGARAGRAGPRCARDSAAVQRHSAEMDGAAAAHVCDFEVQLGWRRQYCGVEKLEMNGVTWYFMDNKYYFGRPYIYGLGGDEYERFGFFCRGALNALPPAGLPAGHYPRP